tara:strand:+ start:590 stop:751 length:162 start_codon:yes stop_codon:yes gene_type:complete
MTTKLQHLLILKDEVAYLKTQIQDGGTGHIHTTIRTLESRIETITKEIESKDG